MLADGASASTIRTYLHNFNICYDRGSLNYFLPAIQNWNSSSAGRSHTCARNRRGFPVWALTSSLSHLSLLSSLGGIHGKEQVWVRHLPGPPLTQRHDDCWRQRSASLLLPMLCPQPLMLSAQSLSQALCVMHWCQQAALQANMPCVYVHIQRGLWGRGMATHKAYVIRWHQKGMTTVTANGVVKFSSNTAANFLKPTNINCARKPHRTSV